MNQPYSPYAPQPPVAVRTDTRAIISLVIGIISLASSFCYVGFLFGIPAVILGILARQAVSKSQGEIGGGGLAIAGAITGGIGTLFSLFEIALVVGMFAFAGVASHSPPSMSGPFPTAPPAPKAMVSGAPSSGLASAHVRFLSPSDGSLEDQLEEAYAEAGKLRLVAVTAAAWSKESIDVVSAVDDAELQAVLATYEVVGVDVDMFKSELARAGMDRPGVPWFFVVGSSGAAIDALSADEWGDNDAHTIAPVLRAFLGRAHTGRRRPKGGTHL
jgi:Domain of unknown function (DUF4190)